MARMARIAVSGFPYHVTQQGNRRQSVFFQEEDYRTYLGSSGSKDVAGACRCGPTADAPPSGNSVAEPRFTSA